MFLKIMGINMQKIMLATIALMLLSSVGYGADWKYIFKDADNSEWFYDTQSISLSQDTVNVWTKIVLSDKAKEDAIKKFQSRNPLFKDEYEDRGDHTEYMSKLQHWQGQEKISITHRIDRYEIDCVKNRIKAVSFAWFDSADEVIQSKNTPDSLFHDIAPDSITAKLAAAVCK